MLAEEARVQLHYYSFSLGLPQKQIPPPPPPALSRQEDGDRTPPGPNSRGQQAMKATRAAMGDGTEAKSVHCEGTMQLIEVCLCELQFVMPRAGMC